MTILLIFILLFFYFTNFHDDARLHARKSALQDELEIVNFCNYHTLTSLQKKFHPAFWSLPSLLETICDKYGINVEIDLHEFIGSWGFGFYAANFAPNCVISKCALSCAFTYKVPPVLCHRTPLFKLLNSPLRQFSFNWAVLFKLTFEFDISTIHNNRNGRLVKYRLTSLRAFGTSRSTFSANLSPVARCSHSTTFPLIPTPST